MDNYAGAISAIISIVFNVGVVMALKNGNTRVMLHWHPIADTDAIKALEMAAKAQATADGKRRVFTDIPRTPYDKGDLWVTSSKDLMVCKTARASGDFNSSEWEKATKYTDDTKANEVLAKLDESVVELNKSITDAQEAMQGYTDEAKAELSKTISDIDNTKANIEDVYDKATMDGVISSKEAETLEKAEELAKAQAELLDEQVKAYADGEISASEQRAIEEAQKRVDAAKADLEEAIKEAEALAVKNLIPNSAFVSSGTSEYSHARIMLPILVSAGEEYTFKCESSSLTSGSDTKYDVYITGADNNTWYSNKYELKFGDNQYVTIKINNTSGGAAIKDNAAWIVLYKKTYPDNGANKAVFNNLSLVKGSTPMAVWQDYQGDNALENILKVDEQYVGSYNNDFYYSESLPFNINAGEKYTFFIEDLEIASGTAPDSQYKVVISSPTGDASTSRNISVGKGDWGTLVIYNNISNSSAILNIWKRGTSTATARITKLSLVKGSVPLMTWKANPNFLKEKVASWAEDGAFSPTEITGLESERKRIEQEKLDINAQYSDAFGNISGTVLTEYNTAYSNYYSDLNSVIAEYNNASDKTKAISVPSTFDASFNAYYEKKTAVVAAISAKIKGNIDAIPTSIANDYGYLKDAFGQITQGDVFLSKLMGVGTRNGKEDFTVNAFMNGSSEISGTEEEGKLMLATGIPVVGGTLKERAAQATTRIYEMGKIVTNNLVATNADITGKVTANDGKIGGVDINTKGLEITKTNGTLRVDSDGFSFTGSDSSKGPIIDLDGCENGNGLFRLDNSSGAPAVRVCPSNDRTALMIATDSGNSAIYCLRGVFSGLRPKLSKVNSAYFTATELDHTLYVTASSSITLPTTPEEGQFYKIIKSKSLSGVQLNGDRFLNLVTGGGTTSYFEIPTNATTIELTSIRNDSGMTIWIVDYIAH